MRRLRRLSDDRRGDIRDGLRRRWLSRWDRWLWRRRFTRLWSRRLRRLTPLGSHNPWTLLSGNQILGLRIDISQSEIVSLAENFRKDLDPRQQSLTITATLEFRSHAQTHLADQTVRKTGPRGLTGLRKEFPAVGREQKQETLRRSCWCAYVPVIGNCQRVS